VFHLRRDGGRPESHTRVSRSGRLGILGALVLLSRPALAAWPSDPTANLPVCTAANDQQWPRLVADGAGGAIFAWEDRRGGVDNDIYVQRVRTNGAVDPAWPANGRALCTATNDQQFPTLVSDGAGGAIVTWQDRRGGVDMDIYAQHVRADGTVDPAWPADGRALCTAAGDQQSPVILADGSGGAIVAWWDFRSGVDFDIYAQHVLATGAVDPVWPAGGRALCTATHNQFSAGIVPDGSGGAIISWQDARGGTTFDVYAGHVMANGTADPAWPTDGRALCTAAENQQVPEIVSDGSGGAVLAWQDQRNGTNYQIFAAHVLATGQADSAWPADGRLLAPGTWDEFTPKLVRDGAGGAIVAWEDRRDFATSGQDIYASHVKANGVVDPAWPTLGRALCTALGTQQIPAIVAVDAGGAIVAWQDDRGPTWDLYATHVWTDGSLDALWPVNGTAISTASGDQLTPMIATDAANGAIIGWQDTRNGNIDVFAQRVLSTATLGGDLTGVSETSSLALAMPNPARRGWIVRFALPSSSPASLDLLDIAGRRVMSREIGSMGAGSHAIDLAQGRQVRPGVYFIRLRQGPDTRTVRVALLN